MGRVQAVASSKRWRKSVGFLSGNSVSFPPKDEMAKTPACGSVWTKETSKSGWAFPYERMLSRPSRADRRLVVCRLVLFQLLRELALLPVEFLGNLVGQLAPSPQQQPPILESRLLAFVLFAPSASLWCHGWLLSAPDILAQPPPVSGSWCRCGGWYPEPRK